MYTRHSMVPLHLELKWNARITTIKCLNFGIMVVIGIITHLLLVFSISNDFFLTLFSDTTGCRLYSYNRYSNLKALVQVFAVPRPQCHWHLYYQYCQSIKETPLHILKLSETTLGCQMTWRERQWRSCF